MKTVYEQIRYLQKLIAVASELHKENPNDDYDKLVLDYKKQISKLKFLKSVENES